MSEEFRKYRVVTDYIKDRLTRLETAEKLNVSETNVSRLKKKILENGANGLIHGLCGKPSNSRKSVEQ